MNSKDKVSSKKFSMLEDWSTLPDAAKELSTYFQKEIKEETLLKFAFLGKLKLSINNYLTPIPARLCPTISAGPVIIADAGESLKKLYAYIPEIGWVWKSDEEIFLPEDIYDFILVGAGYCFVQTSLLKPSGFRTAGSIPVVGFFLIDRLGQVFELQEFFPNFTPDEIVNGELITNPYIIRGNYRTAFELPEYIVLGVRERDLCKLVVKLAEEKSARERKLSKNTENTGQQDEERIKKNDNLDFSENERLIRLIHKFAVDFYDYNPGNKRNKVHVEIPRLATLYDLEISDDTVRNCIAKGAGLKKAEKHPPPARKTLVTIFFTMVSDHYEYKTNDNKSTVFKDVKDDAESVGINISSEEVKKWLKEGKTLKVPK